MPESPLAPDWLRVPDDVNDLAAQVWTPSATRDADGVLRLGGVRVDDLAAEYGTPLYVVDETEVRARAAEARAAFDAAAAGIGTTARVYYAGKAFLTTHAARWVSDAGLGIDVASAGELAAALAAGVDPATIGVHGNNKTPADLDAAVAAGVGAIVIDSPIEIERVALAAHRHGRVQPVRLRINSGVHASTHAYLATAHEDQKFGVPLSAAAKLVAEIRRLPQLEFRGLHSHIGSQIFAVDGFAEAARRLLALHAELLEDGPVPELNLGGGFGIAYTRVDEPSPLPVIADGIAAAVAAACHDLGIAVPVIAVEPGRSIVGRAGATLYTVGTVKPVAVSTGAGVAWRRYVSVDGGMSDNIRPALYGADYSARIVSRRSSAAPALSRVVGSHCESGDIVVRDEYLPGDAAPGDLLAVPATGAYGWSMASNYNWTPRPAVVAVAGGSARVLVRRETIADLLSRDTGAAT